MTERADLPMNFGRDLQLLTRDLTRISGTFEEVATVWRRAHSTPWRRMNSKIGSASSGRHTTRSGSITSSWL